MTIETAEAPASRPPVGVAESRRDALPSEFGGYRVVRVLSRSVHTTTAVVHARGETHVARVYSAECPTGIIDSAIAVHDVIARADPALREHAVALHDLVTLPDGRLALIRELIAGPALVGVLETRRGQLALGEAVTILAPLGDALEAAHMAGLTGLSVSADDVRFSAAGAPVIVRLTDAHAGPVLPDRFRALEPAYADDVARAQVLGAAVTAAVVDADRPGLAATLAAPRSARPLSAALFDLATPIPVVLHTPAVGDREVGPAVRLDSIGTPVSSVPLVPVVPVAPAATTSSPPPRWIVAALDTLGTLGIPSSVVDRVHAVTEGVIDRVARVTETTAPVVERVRGLRRGYLIAGAAGLAALVAAIALGATGTGAETDRTVADSVPLTESHGGASAPPIGSEAGEQSLATPIETPEVGSNASDGREPESLIDPSPDEWPAVVDELIKRWLECRGALARADTHADPRSELDCAAQVTHAGSAAARLIGDDDPRHEMLRRWAEQGGESIVVERMGGAALIDLLVPATADTMSSTTRAPTTAASLLVVRSEAGWRVRDVLVNDLVD